MRRLKLIATLLLALLPASVTRADEHTEAAAAYLRAGDAAAALAAAKDAEGPEARFWQGRALLALGRYSQAAEQLAQVPAQHPLFPYAAKGQLYCAWQSPSVDINPALLHCGNAEIETLAQAAYAEYRLGMDDGLAHPDDAALLEELRDKAAENEALRPLLQLLEIADLRHNRKDYEAAIIQCRRLERDRTLPLALRHRVRLALAEVYYAQEAAAPAQISNGTDDEDDDEESLTLPEAPVAHGRGEETLLHFISANPESPLLNEAFRRLMKHGAFMESEAARMRLKEWCSDMRYPRRAALALLTQQHLLNPEGAASELPPDTTCVNAAVAALPKESATQTMLLEQVRLQLQRGNRTDAALYLAGLAEASPRRDFLAAHLIDNPGKAAEAFLAIAHAADENLQRPAYINALLCALRAGNQAMADAIRNEAGLPARLSAELKSLTAAYLAEGNPPAGYALLQELGKENPEPELRADVLLDSAALQLAHPELFGSCAGDELTLPDARSPLSEEQTLRCITLREQQYRACGDEQAALNCIAASAAATKDKPHLHAVLCIHLAHLLSAEDRHAQALQVLRRLTEEQPKGELTPRARMLAARQAELIGSLDSLKTAAEIYGQCAEDNTPAATRCALRRAAVLCRIGEADAAEEIIRTTLRKGDALRAEDQVLAHAILANVLVQYGTEESLQAAVHAASEMLGISQLSPRWQALAMLHHGMICSRAGKHDSALSDYLAVLKMKPEHTEALTPKDWSSLCQAAAGAVYEYSNSGRYEEAARMAEEAAAWGEAPGPGISGSFARWAKNIRTTHFLPAATEH